MLKIIDRTLLGISRDRNVDDSMLYKMSQTLLNLGISDIEIKPEIVSDMRNMPVDGHYIMHINSLEEVGQYPEIDTFIYSMTPEDIMKKLTDDGDESYKCADKFNNKEIIVEILTQTIDPILNFLEKFSTKKEIEDKINSLGADRIRITGCSKLIFDDYSDKLGRLVKKLGNKLEFCPTDRCQSATALALEYIRQGGKNVCLSFNGTGGIGKLEEVLTGIKIILNKKIKMDLSVLPKLKNIYEQITQLPINYNKAIIGKNIFNLEAGIRKNTSKHNELTYEPYDPAVVGKTRKIIIGKYSCETAVKLKLDQFGIADNQVRIKDLIEEIQGISMNLGRSLSDKEFITVVQRFIKKK